MKLSFRINPKHVRFGISIFIVAFGSWLISMDVTRAWSGDVDAVLLFVCFGILLVAMVQLVRRYWTLILDDRDTLEVFTQGAIRNQSRVMPFHRAHERESGIINERGYSYSIRDGETEVRLSLIFLGKETSDHKTIIGEQALLTTAIRIPQPFDMVIVNPRTDIRESLDVEFYAPLILNSKRYSYHRHGLVFSNYNKNKIQEIFDNPFLQTEMIDLFERCHFKFAVFDTRHAMAIKNATVHNMSRDIETYPVLENISRLIASYYQQPILI